MGLFKCLRYEDGGSLIRMISLVGKNSGKFSLDKEFYREQLEKDLAVNIYKNSSWGSYKYFNYTRKEMRESENCHAEVVVPGDITQIKMVENFPYSRNQKNAIHVYYAGMNFKDILIAGGILRLPGLDKNNFEIGYEFSGRTADGQRVFGIRRDHCFATTVDFDTPVLKVPDNWTLEEAASVPIIYFTLYYAFHYKTKMESGKSILIHSASGGVGLAAIQMALNHKCKIFATVGSEAKKKALLELYPDLDANNIFSSREDSFEVAILRLTNGYGVDYVLNSLVGDLFNASMKCIASNGNFIEIGKTEFLLNSRIESSMFLKSTSLHGIAIDELLTVEKRPLLKEFTVELEKELKQGRIKPIPSRKVFDVDDITEAFKYFQTTNHVGKILLKVREEEKSPICNPSFRSLKAIPKLFFNPCKSYIIIGGLGGLGLEFAMMLSLKGAKHIFLNSRSPPKHGYQLNIIRMIKSWGTSIYINHDDCSSLNNARNLLNEAISIAPVGGIFNMAMVNKDASLIDQTIENFIEVYKPKGCITENLDILSRKLCPDLDHFVVYSSITCGKGNLGQTNYGYANSTMERIVEKRNDDKLPGVAIQWGPIADVGYFARTSKKGGVGYYIAQPVSSYYDVLQEFLLNSSGILASSLLRDVIQTIRVGDSLLESLMKLFGITNPEKLSDDTTLLELGMDSLMGFEIKQYLYREHNIDITVSELRSKTIKEIKEIDEKRKNNTL
ncbi:hypothetical protein WA026_015585 [Henosepilachna vigintioctopunctata]|uniref:Carrier domain-containing protein n=1 Tax=Henosepilachna vigintioctopunctata TaxID=420089 RepID=A0AAW1VF81_9CUCU